jgi:hypothetical protein
VGSRKRSGKTKKKNRRGCLIEDEIEDEDEDDFSQSYRARKTGKKP